jgi:hypothetical protein
VVDKPAEEIGDLYSSNITAGIKYWKMWQAMQVKEQRIFIDFDLQI